MSRNTYTTAFKAETVLEALRGEKTMDEIAAERGINANMLRGWRKLAVFSMAGLLEPRASDGEAGGEEEPRDSQREEMLRTVLRLTEERDSLRQAAAGLDKARRRELIDGTEELSVRRQCELLGVNRSTIYYEKRQPDEAAVREKEEIMARLRYWCAERPQFGSRRLVEQLKEEGYTIGRKRVRSLLEEMGFRPGRPGEDPSRGTGDLPPR